LLKGWLKSTTRGQKVKISQPTLKYVEMWISCVLKKNYLEIKVMKWVTNVDSMDFNVVIIGCMGTLIVPISVACFENICEKCHLPYFTNINASYYC
jgi:hypothetical protein